MIHSCFSLILYSFGYRNCLLHSLLVFDKNELLGEELFSDRHTFDLNSIVILAVFLHVLLLLTVLVRVLAAILILVFLFVFNPIILLFFSFLVHLHRFSDQLVQDVLDLSLKLFIGILHDILKHISHA